MKGSYNSLAFLSFILLFISSVWGACKTGETDPWKPHPAVTQRVYTYQSQTPYKDISTKTGTRLDVLTYNIQSGLSQACVSNPEIQGENMRAAHFFGLQEVDVNVDLRGYLNQPEYFADRSGKTVLYFHTIFYRTGMYGSAMGTAMPILETRYHVFQNWVVEERGILAIRTTPPQLQGRTLWYLNTHFHFDGDYWKQKQAEETVAFVKSLAQEFPQALFILTGDFYIVPGVVGYSIMETYFQNAWSVYTGSSSGGETYPANYPSNRYDHIWYRFPAGTQYGYSDHRPIWGHFYFESITPPPIGGCEVRVTLRQDGEAWPLNGNLGKEGQFVIEVYNSGTKSATRVNFDVVTASGSSITSWWNFAPLQSYMDLPVLSPGASYYSGGFILSFPSSTNFIAPTISYKNTICN